MYKTRVMRKKTGIWFNILICCAIIGMVKAQTEITSATNKGNHGMPTKHSGWTNNSESTMSTGDDYDANRDNFDDTLTPDSNLHLTNDTGENITEAQVKEINEAVNSYVSWEWNKDIRHFADFKSYMRTCYYLATTYKNAMRDLRKYYRIRYLYVETKEYEIGYVTHEIVYKYQIVLELFNLIQRKFYHNQHRQYAPTTYMLYMYSNILHQSTDIIHLCNMLHEIEKKYQRRPAQGAWYTAEEGKGLSNKTYQEKIDAIHAYQKRRQKMERKREKARKKRMKELQKGVLFKTTQFTTRRTKLFWDLHYGWSIEYW